MGLAVPLRAGAVSESAYTAFFGAPPSPFAPPVPSNWRRALSAALALPVATGTLLVLYEHAANAVHSFADVVENAWVPIWPSREQLAEELGLSRNTVLRHLAALEAIGAIKRDGTQMNSKNGRIWVRSPILLTAELEQHAAVQAVLRERNPNQYDPQVTPLAQANRQERAETRAWVADQQARTAEALMGHPNEKFHALLQESRWKTAERKEARENKPAAAKMGKGIKKKAAGPKEDSADVYLRRFNEAIRTEFQNAFNPVHSVKTLSQMRQLLDRFGTADVEELIVFLTNPENFAKAKARWPKIELLQPTPGFMLAWAESLLPWIRQGANPSAGKVTATRSGGAEMYERPERDERGRLDF